MIRAAHHTLTSRADDRVHAPGARIGGLACAAALAICVFPGARAVAADSIWELSSYDVRAFVALSDDPELAGALGEELLATLRACAAAVVGPYWTFEAGAAPPALRELLLTDWSGLSAEQVLPFAGESPGDKLLLLRVSYEDGAYQVAAREFDVRTRRLGTPVVRRVVHRAALADAAFGALVTAFAPLARIETLVDDEVTLRVRGAAVPTRDPALAPVRPGTIFQAVIRVNDRAGNPQRIQPLDWTYLVAREVEGSRVAAKLITGLRSPISGRPRGRTEQIALAVGVPEGSTELALRGAGESGRPLGGYRVYAHPVDVRETALLGSTDARGQIEIPPGEGGVRVLLVKSGETIVARLPIVPGIEARQTAQLPDDDRRLQVEGYITGFQESFVDLVARRQVLIARIRAKLKANQRDEAQALYDQLRRLPTQQELSQSLMLERQRLRSDDPRTQRQIEKLFDDTQTVVTRFLSPRPIEELERELRGTQTAQAPPEEEG